ncbi:MAG: hypothetical protein AAF378_19905 [Cyanobacteria bacterium P01_A01_bin.84]
MDLSLEYFDTKTKQYVGVKQKLTNSLAQYLFPETKFSIGIAYPSGTTPSDLEEEFEGMSLQFSSGEKMFFADNPDIRSKLYPNSSDGAAYPLAFTPCLSFHELHNVRVLVVDDVTGENGDVINKDNAKQLVGDCKGLIDSYFAKANNIKQRAFQFRLGIKPQEASPVMRIAKGTLAPSILDRLGESSFSISGSTTDDTFRAKFGYDMVLATSSFKGRKDKDSIKPGEYILDIGLGVKSIASYREHSLGTQVLVNYPEAVQQEILPIIKKQAEKLAFCQQEPIRMVKRYIETYERRKKLAAKTLELDSKKESDISEKFSIFDNLNSGNQSQDNQDDESFLTEQKDLLIYSLLKADNQGFNQLTEHPKIISELQDFVRKQWLEIATGRSIKFTSGLAQPSLYLDKDEICVPYLNNGEEVIVTRSPLINSNGVITLKNKHLPYTQNGCVYIHPKTAMDNMQCDFDGDLLAFAPSSQFPILAAEVKHNNLPSNRYPDIVKKAKVPYQGTFAEIVIGAMENKIGIIANEIQKNIALQCEMNAIPKSEINDYRQQVLKHFNKVLQQNKQADLEIPEYITDKIQQVISTNIEINDTTQVEQQLEQIKNILFDCVAQLGNELQVAADGPKSALRPDDKIIKYCQKITAYKEVEWLTDKKNPEAFTHRGIKSNGYSPIDLIAQQTNQIFEQNQLVARPVEQFRKLYSDIECNSNFHTLAKEIKDCYNSKIRQRIQLEEWKKVEHGPYLVITSPSSGKQLEITNLIKFKMAKNPDFWKASELNIKIKSSPANILMPHTFEASVLSKNSNGELIDTTIGTISMKSIKEHDLKSGMIIKQGKVKFHFGISNDAIDALKQQTKEYVESIRNSTPDNEKLHLAAAIHDVSHTPDNKNYSGLKRASVSFAIFPEVVIEQLKQLQFTQMRAIGIQFNEFAHQSFSGEKVAIEFEDDVNPRDPSKNARWIKVEGKKLGLIDARSPNLISGCKALANIHSPPSNSIIASSLRNPQNQLKIDSVNKYAFASHQWKGEATYITFDVEQTNSGKVPRVFALMNDRVLGVVNKQSINFLKQQLKGKSLQGLKIKAKLDNAPVSYADIIIDSDSVKFSEVKKHQEKEKSPELKVTSDKKNICTVAFFAPPVTQQFQARTGQMMSNMLKRAVDRAVENSFSVVEFVDISTVSDKSPLIAQTLHQLQEYRKDINVEFIGTKSLEEGMRLLKKPSDIAIGVKSIATNGMIEVLANQGKVVAAYVPETGDFDRRNLPRLEKKHEMERQ